MIIIQNQEALQEAIQQNQIVIVQFGSESCAPCKALQNRIKTWNQTHVDVCHVYVTVAEMPELCAQMGVFTVPTIFGYVQGKLTIQQSGYFSLDQMLAQVEKYEQILSVRSIKAGYIQFDVKHNKAENFRCIEHHLKTSDSELVVLPELCICGYLFPNKNALLDVAEKVPCGASTLKMQELSEKYQCIIVFGLAEKEGGHVYNTAVVVGYGKYMGKYRKVHLSDLEKTLFERGDHNSVIDTGRFKLGVQICFDLWFPEIAREQVKQGADVLCALANFGGETTAVIARTRAIENLTPLVMCNRIGTEQTSQIDAYFLGKSAILDAAGECVSACEADSEMMSSGVLKIGAKHSNIICRDFDAEMSIHPLNPLKLP